MDSVKYAQYNRIDKINETIVVYRGNHPIGGGLIRPYDENTVELKRVFVIPNEQGKGIGTELVSKLIEWAKKLGYKKMILETGELLAEPCQGGSASVPTGKQNGKLVEHKIPVLIACPPPLHDPF